MKERRNRKDISKEEIYIAVEKRFFCVRRVNVWFWNVECTGVNIQ
jgi:hypothetical protein